MSRELKKRKLSVGPCEFCKKAETMDMVQCDNCDKWFHFHCVGVGPIIVYLDWSCYVCKNQKENRRAKNSQGRHENCKKPVLPKINYLASQSKHIESADKRQIRELSENVAEMKVQLGVKNGRIEEQNEMIEVQRKKLEVVATDLADLKIEKGLKDDRINEQNEMMEVQRKKIEGVEIELANLKLENGLKDGRIKEQNEMIEVQRKKIEGVEIDLADLKVEIESKNDRITEQRNMLQLQQKRIDMSNAKANVLGIDPYKKGGNQQQGGSFEEVIDGDKEVDAVAAVGIFMNLLCDTEEELVAFNTKLRNPKLICGLQDKFCIFGGDLKTFVIGMVNRIMSKNLQSKLSWSGKRTSKPGFAEMTNITDLIHFCCAKKFGTYDTKAGEQIIQKLLQNA